MNHGKLFFLLGAACLIPALGLPRTGLAFDMEDPAAVRKENASYRTLRDGSELDIRKRIELEVSEKAYTVIFTNLTDNGQSRYITVFSRGKSYRPVRYLQVKTDPSGKTLIKGDIRLKDNPHYAENTCPLFGNYFALRTMTQKDRGARFEYPCLFPGGSTFTLVVRTGAIETIETPAGSFECLRIEETLDVGSLMGMGGFLGSLLRILPVRIVPKTVYWYDRKFPYLLIKREGVAGAPPNDYVVTDELVSFIQEG